MVSTTTKRSWWADYACQKNGKFPYLNILGTNTPVNPRTVEAWKVFDHILRTHGYDADSAWAYNCRRITGGTGYSLHAYGIALDVDPKDNPYLRLRTFKWSDTKFTPEQVEAVLAVKTNSGEQVFSWGGNWRTIKDYMHWEIECQPSALDSGIAYEIPEEDEEMVYKKGDKGFIVAALQEGLKALGYPTGNFTPFSGSTPDWFDGTFTAGSDGDYGSTTSSAVKMLQRDIGVTLTGEVGYTEFNILMEAVQNAD